MKTIKFVPSQDLTVRKAKNGNSLLVRVIDEILNNQGITLTEQSGGLYNLMITADSPKVLAEDFTINAGDELTIIVADVAAVKAGDDIGNGQKAAADREAFKQFRIVGYTTLEQRLKTRKAQHQLSIMDQQLTNAKAVTQATVDAIKSGKLQPTMATADDLSLTDKW